MREDGRREGDGEIEREREQGGDGASKSANQVEGWKEVRREEGRGKEGGDLEAFAVASPNTDLR